MRRKSMRTSLLTVVGVLALTSAPAGATAHVEASLTADVPISAQSGWLVWSVPAAGGWRLVAKHHGQTAMLAVRPRRYPFDVDLGTDAHGHPVATFSRCAQYPRESNDRVPPAAIGALDAGCKVRSLDLRSGVERPANEPRRSGMSDVAPSMWRGRLAYAEHPSHPVHDDVPEIVLWSPRTGRLVREPHGYVTSCVCRLRTLAIVDAIDLSSRMLAFTWDLASAPSDHDYFEIRADLPGAKTVLAAWGYLGESCGRSHRLTAPAVSGNTLWFVSFTDYCSGTRSTLTRYSPYARRGRSGSLDPTVIRFAMDGSTLYGLVATDSTISGAPNCSSPGRPCKLMRLALPLLNRRIGAVRRPI